MDRKSYYGTISVSKDLLQAEWRQKCVRIERK